MDSIAFPNIPYPSAAFHSLPQCSLSFHLLPLDSHNQRVTVWNSIIADPDAPKTGVIIDFSVFSNVKYWTCHLPFYIHSKVPVFINWGTHVDYVQTDCTFNILRPSKETFIAMLKHSRHWWKVMKKNNNPKIELPKCMF